MSVPQGKIPTYAEVCERIDHAGDRDYRACLRAIVLMCARASEVVGESSPSDVRSPARGPTGEDAKDLVYTGIRETNDEGRKENALVIVTKTAKRQGMERWVGIPADYEPWARPTAEYFWNNRPLKEKVFPFTRQALGEYVRSNNIFEGFVWNVLKYDIVLTPTKRDNLGNILAEPLVKKVGSHEKPFTLHSLRDCRATYLISVKRFDGPDLAIHGGWAINRAETGVSQVMARYIDIYRDWARPFSKLLPPWRPS